jgi:hypothetical protein
MKQNSEVWRVIFGGVNGSVTHTHFNTADIPEKHTCTGFVL